MLYIYVLIVLIVIGSYLGHQYYSSSQPKAELKTGLFRGFGIFIVLVSLGVLAGYWITDNFRFTVDQFQLDNPKFQKTICKY